MTCPLRGLGFLKPDTLIVVAAYDDSFAHNLETIKGGDVIVWDTSQGGHPSKAYIDAFRKHYYRSYLFLQDSLRGNVEDVVQPFRENGKDVVAWGTFDFFFDDQLQAQWVLSQYPGARVPMRGIFGPIFYATRKAMKKLEDKRMFPETPPNHLMAQGTERAWAFAFYQAGIPVGQLSDCVTDGSSPRLFPADKTFTKTFAGRA